ncbi:MAG: hypothetical protein MJ211_06425 [Bacteroidales bacterium]|nr:hypothetical protein [Bacteroidales bacterium]
MNKTLSIFVNDDYLVVAVQPLKDKFSLLFTNDEKKFPLYFYINPSDSSIDYGFDYKINFRDNKNLFAGDLMLALNQGGKKIQIGGYDEDYITLFNPIIRDIRELYSKEMSKYEDFDFSETTIIDTCIIFSENITQKAQNEFIKYWQNKNFNFIKNEKFDCQLLKYYVSKNGLFCQNRKFAILEALGMDLNMSIINVDGQNITRIANKKFEGYGIDPRIKVIAKKIVDDVNRQENIIDRDNLEAINREYIRHYDKALKIIDYISKNSDKSMISLTTSFVMNQSNKIKVNLSVDEINKLSYLYSRQFSAFFSDSFLASQKIKAIDLDKIFLVGNSLGNNTVHNEFINYGEAKIETFSDEISFVLSEFYREQVNQENLDEESTQFMVGAMHRQETIKPETPTLPTYSSVDNLQLSTLKNGNKVLLNTFDPNPGKGAAIQELLFMGDGTFQVIKSTRTLKPGDKCQPVSDQWNIGVQIDFFVTRNGQSLGRFRTRKVVKISIM